MELELSKEKLQKIAILSLVAIGVIALALRVNWGGMADKAGGLFSVFQPAALISEDEPALAAVEAIFAPVADRSEWESAVCVNMTEDGCRVFKSIYADALFRMPRVGAGVSFVGSVDEFEDGTRVWLLHADVTDAAEPLLVYVHVAQDESGDWLLMRVLFDQETEKYANQTP